MSKVPFRHASGRVDHEPEPEIPACPGGHPDSKASIDCLYDRLGRATCGHCGEQLVEELHPGRVQVAS
jgi:hypothetical protein